MIESSWAVCEEMIRCSNLIFFYLTSIKNNFKKLKTRMELMKHEELMTSIFILLIFIKWNEFTMN